MTCILNREQLQDETTSWMRRVVAQITAEGTHKRTGQIESKASRIRPFLQGLK